MRSGNNHSNIHVLVLVRPADSMSVILPAFLREHQYPYSVCPTLYHVQSRLGVLDDSQPAVLIARPAMLRPAAKEFFARQCPELRIIGWLERDERISDLAFGPLTENAMVMADRLDRLEQALAAFSKSISRRRPLKADEPMRPAGGFDPKQYELSDAEVDALLGAG